MGQFDTNPVPDNQPLLVDCALGCRVTPLLFVDHLFHKSVFVVFLRRVLVLEAIVWIRVQ